MSLAVVIPNYNKEKYLEKCISSIMEQTLLPDEIWIVDDCSKDHSREMIADMQTKNPRIKTILFEKNQGVSAARNAGIRAASTKYITTLDSDDFFYDKNKLAVEMECLHRAEAEGKENVLVYSKTVTVNEQGEVDHNRMGSDRHFLEGKIFLKLLAECFYGGIIPRDYCVRRELMIEAGLYDTASRYFEDFDLLLRMTKKCEVIYSHHEGIGYRYVASGLSHQGGDRYKQMMKSLRAKYSQELSWCEKVQLQVYMLETYARRAKNKLISLLKRQ